MYTERILKSEIIKGRKIKFARTYFDGVRAYTNSVDFGTFKTKSDAIKYIEKNS